MSEIEVKHLSKTFEQKGVHVDALKDINLTIGAGDIYGIIGMSGAGKSTLVRCLNFLERPTDGQVLIEGKDLGTLNEKELRKQRSDIAMIFQHFNLLSQRDVRGNIAFAMEIAGMKRPQIEKRIDELLEIVGLTDRQHNYPSQLSGGQQQRVAIARALATHPKVLLCDEATSALDPNTTHAILTLIKDINKKLGITVVVITHQMSVIEEICTRVAILDGGEVAEEGRVEDIFAHPATDAARRLVYPGGVSAKQYPAGTRAVRVSFNGGTVYDPLIASLAIDCGVKVTILGADTRTIDGKAFGTMLLLLPDDPNEAAKALSYIRSQPNITAEEVEYHA